MKKKINAPARLLRRTIKLIEAGWTKGALARDRQGRQVDFLGPRAQRFCLVGAVARGWNDMRHQPGALAYATAAISSHVSSAPVDPRTALDNRRHRYKTTNTHTDFNDAPWRTKAQVLAVLRAALKDVA